MLLVLEIVSIAPAGISSRCLFVFRSPAASSVAATGAHLAELATGERLAERETG